MFSWKKHIIALVLVLNMIGLAIGQTNPPPSNNTTNTTVTSPTTQSTPTGLAKGVNPLGRYGGSNFDKVNLFNGNVSMSFPLASLTSRGGMAAGVVLSYNSKIWYVDKVETDDSAKIAGEKPTTVISYIPEYGNYDPDISSLAPGWTIHAGALRVIHTAIINKSDRTCVFPGPGRQPVKPQKTITIVSFTAPDGTEYDFRDRIYDGEPKSLVDCEPISRGKRFESKDGTAATFVSDTEIKDTFFSMNETNISGYVYLRDGTRFRIEQGRAVKQRDHNGNLIKYVYEGNRLKTVVDNMGRTIEVRYDPSGQPGVFATITVKGIGGQDRVTTIRGSRLGNNLITGQPKTLAELFPVPAIQLSSENINFNPRVVSKIILPDSDPSGTPEGHQWDFKYNAYGEVVRVKTPAKGAVEFEMGPSINTNDGGYDTVFNQIFRRVTQRRTFPSNSTQMEGKATYSDPTDPSKIANGDVTVEQTEVDPNDNDRILAKSTHKFSGHPKRGLDRSGGTPPQTGYRPWLEGKELITEQLNFDGTTVMRRSVTDYQQQSGVAWVPGADITFSNQPENNPRVIRTTNSLLDGGDKTSKVDYEYDAFNNVTEEVLTGYNNEIIRRVERTYITNLNSIDYTSLNAQENDDLETVLDTHLRSLIDTETIKNSANNIETVTKYDYDKYTGTNNATLVPRTLSIDTHAQAYQSNNRTQRGNVTSVTAGFGTDEGSIVYSHYDVLGNVVEVVGPLDNQKTTTQYSAQSLFTFPVSTTQQVRGGQSGDRDLTTTRTFDFSTGAVLTSTGLNNDTTTFQYNDPLDRLTLEIRPDDTQLGGFGRTEYTYSAPGAYPNTVTVKSSLDDGGNRKLTSISEFDGFLRTTKQFRTDGADESQPKVLSQTFYDALGRVNKVNNPFRENQSNDTDGSTTSQYDALSRVFRIQTFDKMDVLTGTVNTVYETNFVTVTDQALKQRKSETDAAGRLINVYEPNDVNQQLDQITSYTYDARSNLKTVNQGVQTREFTYDALSRLTSAKSPESGDDGDSTAGGTTTYEYDKASNLKRREDPRHVVTTYAYDSLNRLTTKDYNDTTPQVSYFYDVAPENSALPLGVIKPTFENHEFTFQNLLGRTVVVASPGTGREMATGLFHTYDKGGRITKSSQFLDEQHYVTSSNYNLASLPTGHIYPSDRTIAHSYNIAGQITQVNSNSQTISDLIAYTPSGAIASHRLGNNLYHQMQYNSRLQPTQITLGSGQTGQAAADIWKQEYNYASYTFDTINGSNTSLPTISNNLSQNNGNIGHIKLTPGIGTNAINQFFVYDELNRLKLAKEFVATTVESECTGEVDVRLSDAVISGDGGYDIESGLTFGNQGQPSRPDAAGSAVFHIDLTDPALVGKHVIIRTKVSVGIDTRSIPNLSGSASMDVIGGGNSSTITITASTDADGVSTSDGIFSGIRGVYGQVQDLDLNVDSAIGTNLTLTFNWQGHSTANNDFADPHMFLSGEIRRIEAFVICPPAPPTTQISPSWSQQYTYDRFGNRSQIQGTNSQSLQIATLKNRLSVQDGYHYDEAGNLKSDPNGFYYFYDAENRLIKVTLDPQGNILYASYFYDANGWRVKKSSIYGSTRFVYDQGGRLLSEYDGEPVPAMNAPTREHIYGASGMLATVEADKINYHTPDHLGSPRVLTDGSGAVISRRDFFPFGDQMDASIGSRSSIQGYIPTNDNIKQKFTGYFRDDESGLDFAQARYFASPLGRFMSLDPAQDQFRENPQSLNLYSYTRNNPINSTDPDGKITPWDILDFAIAASSVKTAIENPTAANVVGAVLDVGGAILPIVPAGAGKALQVLNKTDDVVDAVKGAAGAKALRKADTAGLAMDPIKTKGVSEFTASERMNARFDNQGIISALERNPDGIRVGMGEVTTKLMGDITKATGREVGLIRMGKGKDSYRILKLGDSQSVDVDIKGVSRLIAHTHPSGVLKLSDRIEDGKRVGDIPVLHTLFPKQRSTVLIGPTGQATRVQVPKLKF